jgi:type II restriction enzyme
MYLPKDLGKKFEEKEEHVKKVILQALDLISSLGIPLEDLTKRRLEKMAMSFLAVIDVKNPSEWPKAKENVAITTREIIRYVNPNFEENISSGSYDDVRRKDLDRLILANIVVKSKPDTATNDSTRGYSINQSLLKLIRSYGTEDWKNNLSHYLNNSKLLTQLIGSAREIEKIPVILPSGEELKFSLGKHNILQKKIIEDFLPRYGYGAEVLYIGDTAEKFMVKEDNKLAELGVFEIAHGELPDVVAYSKSKNWLYFIEAVYSSGPISEERKLKLERLLENCSAGIVFVTAFLNRETFRRYSPVIAWETEVWIADNPDHMVHFNGDKFIGPHD